MPLLSFVMGALRHTLIDTVLSGGTCRMGLLWIWLGSLAKVSTTQGILG